MESFTCPVCGNKIERRHAFFLNNFSTIECSKCHSRLVPELRKTAGIGALYGAIGGFMGFTIPTLAIIMGKPVLGIALTLALGIGVYFIVVDKTFKSIRFKLKE